MERGQRMSLEDQVRTRIPGILAEMHTRGLDKGARIDHVKAVLPRYAEPDVLEQVLGKAPLKNNGGTTLEGEQILYLYVHHDFGKALRNPQIRKGVKKIIRRSYEEYAQ